MRSAASSGPMRPRRTRRQRELDPQRRRRRLRDRRPCRRRGARGSRATRRARADRCRRGCDAERGVHVEPVRPRLHQPRGHERRRRACRCPTGHARSGSSVEEHARVRAAVDAPTTRSTSGAGSRRPRSTPRKVTSSPDAARAATLVERAGPPVAGRRSRSRRCRRGARSCRGRPSPARASAAASRRRRCRATRSTQLRAAPPRDRRRARATSRRPASRRLRPADAGAAERHLAPRPGAAAAAARRDAARRRYFDDLLVDVVAEHQAQLGLHRLVDGLVRR